MGMSPFVAGADDYLAAGWHPFPAYHTKDKSKAPCVKGVIGWDAIDVTADQVAVWKRQYKSAQLGLRLPKNVIGIDVDMYDGKGGRARFRALVDKYGPLPPTWISTSRQDGSGIWMFHVEDSSQYPHDLTGGIELIRWCGRFIMAAPSTHPKTGAQYGWIRPDREFVLDEFPSALNGDLATLPERWVAGLSTEVRPRARGAVVVTPGIEKGIRKWIESRPGGKSEPCPVMYATFRKYNWELSNAGEGSRHSAALIGVHALIGNSCEGHSGLYGCLRDLCKTLIRKRGNGGDAHGEFYRMVESEVEKRVAGRIEDEDPCEVFG